MTAALVQHVGSHFTGVASGSLTLTSTGTGNLHVSVLSTPLHGSTITSIKYGTLADNWAQFYTDPGGNPVYVWWDKNGASGKTSITTAISASDNWSWDFFEISGVGTAPTVDQQNSADTSGGGAGWTVSTPGAVTAGEFVIGALAGYNNAGTSTTITGPSTGGWTNETQQTPSTGIYQLASYLVPSSSGTLTYAGTSNMTSPNQFSVALIISFQASTGRARVLPVSPNPAVVRAAWY